MNKMHKEIQELTLIHIDKDAFVELLVKAGILPHRDSTGYYWVRSVASGSGMETVNIEIGHTLDAEAVKVINPDEPPLPLAQAGYYDPSRKCWLHYVEIIAPVGHSALMVGNKGTVLAGTPLMAEVDFGLVKNFANVDRQLITMIPWSHLRVLDTPQV